jgi:group I intron endonuclease
MNKQELECNDTTKTIEKQSLKKECSDIGIYGLRNKSNGKWYIGQSWKISQRWNRYKNLNCKKQIKLFNALHKYGYNEFECSIIESFDSSISQELLDARENFWIIKYNSVDNGYNLTYGGQGGKRSNETREKIRIALTGAKFTEERKCNISKSLIGKIPSNKGIAMNITQKELLRKNNSYRKKLVEVLDLSGKVIDAVCGMHEVSRKYGIDRRLLQRIIKKQNHCHSWKGMDFRLTRTSCENVPTHIQSPE